MAVPLDSTTLTIGLAAAFIATFTAGGGTIVFLSKRFAKHADFVALSAAVEKLTDALTQYKLDARDKFITSATFTAVSAEHKAELRAARTEINERLDRVADRMVKAIRENGHS